MRVLLALMVCCHAVMGVAQDDPFPFGTTVSYRELEMSAYEKDTAAAAVVLNEFGEAFIDNENDYNLIFRYHVKIKILKKSALSQANISILLYKADGRYEKIRDVDASSFNIENGSMKETKLLDKNVFTENYNEYWDARKFAIPNVRVGSVIEYQYELESPFFAANFRTWEFQSDLPKLYSEYWATIPANYRYNIALKGLLPLSKNDGKVLKDYFTPGGGRRADCARYMWAMKDIPAFVEEEYMTAKRNFLSAIYFELEEIEYFDGRKDKVTKDWKDAEQELRTAEKFGLQIRRGKDIVDAHVALVTANEADPLVRAQKIYEFIRNWYRWDEYFGKYSEFGIKKAFDRKTGNVGDINLSLIAALKYADFSVEPMILATREKGLPTELYPVLTDFNYVVAKLNLEGKTYLLDATDDFVPFGVLPERCLNGKGRVFGDEGSYWHEIKPAARAKQLSLFTLRLEADGYIRGTIETTSIGYRGADKRRKIYGFQTPEEYITDLNNKWDKIDIKSFTLKNLENFSKPLVEKLEIEIEAFDPETDQHFLFNPFIVERWTRNPFKSSERVYPVDFGAPLDETIIMSLEHTDVFEVVQLPERVGLALPGNGGRFLFNIVSDANKITMNNTIQISKTVFTSTEYHYLKELFSRVVSTHGADIILRKRATN